MIFAVVLASIVVQPPVRVSPPGAGPHFWWTIAASPTDPAKLIVCAQHNQPAVPRATQDVLYGSEDSGQTWRPLFADPTPSYTSEVHCALGSNRTVYFVASNGIDDALTPLQTSTADSSRLERMHLRRSTDFGQHWRDAPLAGYADSAVLIVRPGEIPDRDRLDIFADSIGTGDEEARALTLSPDGARSLSAAVRLPDLPVEPEGFVEYLGDAIQLGDGSSDAVFSDNAFVPTGRRSAITISRVASNGTSLGPPAIVASVANNGPMGSREASIAAGILPHTKRERVYVVWSEWASSRTRVMLAISDDAGKTWSRSHTIDDLPAKATRARDTSALYPSVAVNAAGVVGVDWGEFSGRCWRFAASLDGGATFSRSVAINTCASKPLPYTENLTEFLQATVRGQSALTIDDARRYEGTRGTGLVASRDSSFRAVWAAFGDGDDALYTSRIDVDDRQLDDLARWHQQYIAAAFARPRELSSRMAWLNYTSVSYDEGTGEFTVGVVVVQQRTVNTKWPVVLRIRGLASRLGPLQVVGADNGLKEDGAAWVFEGPAQSLPAGSQAANMRALPSTVSREYSEPRVLRFRLKGPAKEPPGLRDVPIVRIKSEVLIPSD